MVRLKDSYLVFLNLSPRISIPYGAIKRLILIRMYKFFFKFQFLMVRLKEKNCR